MKKIILFCSIAILTFQSEAQQTDYSWLKNGLKLRYYLHEYDKNYEFMVELTSIKTAKEFNWWMTWPVNRIGSCVITENAIQNAISQQNYFSGGLEYLDNRTTGYVSYAVYQAMKNKGSITINPTGQDEVLKYLYDVPYQTVLDGKTIILPTMYCETNRGSKYWILDNPNDPIIMKMVVDFNIEIGEMMTPEYWEN